MSCKINLGVTQLDLICQCAYLLVCAYEGGGTTKWYLFKSIFNAWRREYDQRKQEVVYLVAKIEIRGSNYGNTQDNQHCLDQRVLEAKFSAWHGLREVNEKWDRFLFKLDKPKGAWGIIFGDLKLTGFGTIASTSECPWNLVKKLYERKQAEQGRPSILLRMKSNLGGMKYNNDYRIQEVERICISLHFKASFNICLDEALVRTLAVGKLRQQDYEFKVNLDYAVRLHQITYILNHHTKQSNKQRCI